MWCRTTSPGNRTVSYRDGRNEVCAMSKLLAAITLLVGILVGGTPASAATIGEVTGFGSNPGNLRMFRYVPDGLPANRPIVLALHGCTQQAAPYGTNAGW